MNARRRRRTPCAGASRSAVAALVTSVGAETAGVCLSDPRRWASALHLGPLLAPHRVVDARSAAAGAVRERRLPERDRVVERRVVDPELVAEVLEAVRRVGGVEVLARLGVRRGLAEVLGDLRLDLGRQ